MSGAVKGWACDSRGGKSTQFAEDPQGAAEEHAATVENTPHDPGDGAHVARVRVSGAGTVSMWDVKAVDHGEDGEVDAHWLAEQVTEIDILNERLREAYGDLTDALRRLDALRPIMAEDASAEDDDADARTYLWFPFDSNLGRVVWRDTWDGWTSLDENGVEVDVAIAPDAMLTPIWRDSDEPALPARSVALESVRHLVRYLEPVAPITILGVPYREIDRSGSADIRAARAVLMALAGPVVYDAGMDAGLEEEETT